MILECPNCNAKFTVPDNAIGAEGKQVRCGKCKNLWLAKPAAAAPVIQSVAIAPVSEEASSAPMPDFDALLSGLKKEESTAKKKSKKAKDAGEKPARPTLGDYRPPMPSHKNPLRAVAYGIVYVLLFLGISTVWVLKDHPEWVGFQPSQGFAFEEMKVERMPQLGGDRFTSKPMYVLEGVVRNTSDLPRPRPPLKVTLKDKGGNAVYIKEYPSPESLIPSGDAVTFTIEKLEQPNADDGYFVVEMGNALEFSLRKIPTESGHAKN